jgi:DNA-binding response OmpR family regulator
MLPHCRRVGQVTWTKKPRVLIYGRDPSLLETRKWIFERAGYRVSAEADLATAEAILATEGPDLYILCHTLSTELRERALKEAHGQRSS